MCLQSHIHLNLRETRSVTTCTKNENGQNGAFPVVLAVSRMPFTISTNYVKSGPCKRSRSPSKMLRGTPKRARKRNNKGGAGVALASSTGISVPVILVGVGKEQLV